MYISVRVRVHAQLLNVNRAMCEIKQNKSLVPDRWAGCVLVKPQIFYMDLSMSPFLSLHTIRGEVGGHAALNYCCVLAQSRPFCPKDNVH